MENPRAIFGILRLSLIPLTLGTLSCGTVVTDGTAQGPSGKTPISANDRVIAEHANKMVEEGRRIFRYDSFGSEAFWGDTLKLHQAIAGQRNGGVGPGLSPKAALGLGLKVDSRALPGSLVADRAGSATPFAMLALQERGSFFIQPTSEVYEGQVVGENSRNEDMDVNITKEKKLTNMRSSTADNFENLVPPRRLTLEESLEFAAEDECVEVTPEAVRIRKVILDSQDRFRTTSRNRRAAQV